MWKKWKTSDISYTQHFSTSELALRKWLSLLQCTKLIWICSRSLSEPRSKSSRTTSEIYPDFVSSEFWSHLQRLCILPWKPHPSSLSYTNDSLHLGIKDEILDCIVRIHLTHQSPLLCWIVLFSFKSFELELLWQFHWRLCSSLLQRGSGAWRQVTLSTKYPNSWTASFV